MKVREWPLVFLLLAGFLLPCSAQTSEPVSVHIRAALFDRDLNLKPVPRLLISIRSLDTPSAFAQDVRTSLEGTAEVVLAPGRYQLTTTSEAQLFGKNYRWDFPITVSGANKMIELSNDNAKTVEAARSAHVDELVEQFQRVRGAAVLVQTERSTHDGVLLDEAGLVLTAHIPSDQQQWIAVSFDEKRAVPATLVADDEKNEASILRINMGKVKDVTIPMLSYDPGALVEGERVFSLNNDSTGKSIRTGVVSKVEEKRIIGDVQFTDIGSPLFNSSGTLIGYTRLENRSLFAVPLNAVREMLTNAREKAKDPTAAPAARLLPVSPGKFPSDALIERHDPRYEKDVYNFKLGEFNISVDTPVSRYQWEKIRFEEQRKARMKRAAKGAQADELKEPTYEYQSIFIIEAIPDYKVPFWANMARTARDPVVLRPKASFHHMRLLCDEREIEPIRPMRFGIRAPENAGFYFDQDSMMGEYSYTPDSVPASCGTVTLEVYATDSPTIPLKKAIENPLRARLWQDFEPFRKMEAQADHSALQAPADSK